MRSFRICVVALAVLSYVAVGAPAQTQAQAATPSLSRSSSPVGAALVRIEAMSVTVAPTPEHAYVLTFTSAITVSWMGEVAKAPGKAKRQLAVGHLSAKDLGRRWAKLRLAR